MARGEQSGVFQPEAFGGEVTLPFLASYMQREFRRLSSAMALGWAAHMEPLHVAPPKPRDGDIAFADGVDWNPGSGVGAYIFYAAAWHPFGGGAGAPGATGPQGPIGFALQGEDGESYPVPGPAGNQGTPGTPGSTGSIGMPGLDAEDYGPPPSFPGPQGSAGATGTQGFQGPPGLDGDAADPEFPIPGVQGPAGATGAQGQLGPVVTQTFELPDEGVWLVGVPTPNVNTGVVTTPAVPASTTAIVNGTGRNVTVYVKAGTLTAITVGGVVTGLAVAAAAGDALTVPLAANQTIAITYTVAPTWVWVPQS